jgi:peptide/nickel transport system substrate-binding protein
MPGLVRVARRLEDAQDLARLARLLLACFLPFLLSDCSRRPAPDTLVMIIESSPANLDPRIGTDAQSERIDKLLFDSLVRRDEHFNLQPSLAERWDIPDPLTYVFHLRSGVRFHDGRALTARDVKWTFDSMLNGDVRTPKTSGYRALERIDTDGDATVVFHLREPDSALLWNLSDGTSGIRWARVHSSWSLTNWTSKYC